MSDGEPKEKPTLPTWAAAPKPTRADVVVDTAELKQPKGEDGLAGDSNVAANTLLGGDVWYISFSLPLS